MMKRICLGIYIFVFMVLFVAPTLQNLFHLFPSKKLDGVEYSADFPALNLASWFGGSFQSEFGSWYDKAYGLRDYFVRTENELNYALFHEISGYGVVLGKKNTMYENCYILDAVGLNRAPTEYVQDTAIKLKKLQDFLEAHGVDFLFIITPSKATIYPEYLPEHVADMMIGEDQSNYHRMVRFLDQYGVNYLDGHAYLNSLKRNGRYPVFCRGGTHWNYYSAYFFTREIMARLESRLGKKLNRLDCEKIDLREKPVGTDDDLARLANLWDKSSLIQKSPYPEVRKTTVAGAIQPNVLFVGGSFVWTILHWLDNYQIINKNSEFYFYFSQKKILDMQKEIFSRDAIILETNEAALSWIGCGFIEEVLNHSHMATASRRENP